jgi:hypothetical protein
VQQVVLALIESLRVHESFWSQANGVVELRRWGTDPTDVPDAPVWDYQSLAAQARHDIGEIRPLLEGVLEGGLLARIAEETSDPEPHSDDELWVTIVYAFVAAAHRGRPSIDQLAAMFVPLYLWRAAAFMRQAAVEADATVEEGLESLCQTFQRLKPSLVERWSAEA